MVCFCLGPDMKFPQSFIKYVAKKLNFPKLFCLGKTSMELDATKSIFKDFFLLIITVSFFFLFIFRGPQISPSWASQTPW